MNLQKFLLTSTFLVFSKVASFSVLERCTFMINDRYHLQKFNSRLCSGFDDETEIKNHEAMGTQEVASNENAKKMESLIFGGTYTYRSKTYSLSLTMQELEENLFHFLGDERIQHMLLSGGKNSTIQKVTIDEFSSDIVSKWYEQADFVKAEQPDPSTDSVVIVTPPGVELVTVKVIPTTTIGTKILSKSYDSDSNLPEFQATLIEDEPRAVGPRFFVWLFNKVVYGGNPDDLLNKKENRRNESALLKLYIDPIEVNEDNVSFCFVAESYMRLEFLFPKLLLRFFPLKKEKSEQLCTDAILKALETNMIPAMESFCEEFESSYQ